VARPNSQDGKTEATLVNIVLLMRFGSATGWPLQYVEEAGGTRLRVGGTRCGSRSRCAQHDGWIRCWSRDLCI